MLPFKKNGQKKGPSQRQLKVSEAIRQSLAAVLVREEFAEPALKGASITVSEVRISPDLKNATAYVMPLGGKNKEAVLEALNRVAPQLRHMTINKMALKFAPRLFFRLDDTYDEANKINILLKSPEVSRDLSGDTKE